MESFPSNGWIARLEVSLKQPMVSKPDGKSIVILILLLNEDLVIFFLIHLTKIASSFLEEGFFLKTSVHI